MSIVHVMGLIGLVSLVASVLLEPVGVDGDLMFGIGVILLSLWVAILKSRNNH